MARSWWPFSRRKRGSDESNGGASGTAVKDFGSENQPRPQQQDAEQGPAKRRKFTPKHAERDALLQMPHVHRASAFQQQNPFSFGAMEATSRHPNQGIALQRLSHGEQAPAAPQQQQGNTFTFSFRSAPDGGIEGLTFSSPIAPETRGVGASEGDMQGVSSTSISPPASVGGQGQSAEGQFLELARRIMQAQLQDANAFSGRRPGMMGPQTPPSAQNGGKGKERVDSPGAGPSDFKFVESAPVRQAFKFWENAESAAAPAPAEVFRFGAAAPATAGTKTNSLSSPSRFGSTASFGSSNSGGGVGIFVAEKSGAGAGAAAPSRPQDSGYGSEGEEMELEEEDTEMVGA